ncbi:hypothetical protein EBR57_00025 [bacterium]|nr:hypothetical protein [bacterium]
MDSEQKEKKVKIAATPEDDGGITAVIAKTLEVPKKVPAGDTKPYDPAKPYEITGSAGTIGVVRGHMNLQRMAGKAVAVALQGLQVDNRTYEMTWMSIMLQFVTNSPGYLPGYCNGNIDKFLENIYEYEDLLYYFQEWESWRNSFRVSGPNRA